MKPAEFNEIKEDFEKEQAFWESLKVGDIIYEESTAGGMSFEYYKMKIDKIDVEERVVFAHDVEGTHRGEISYGFLTQEMFDKLNTK